MIHAAPGIYLVELIEDKSAVDLGPTKDKQVLKGKILDVGANRQHDDGGEMVATRKAGDIVWFFSYVSGADFFKENSKKYYTILFNDTRAYDDGIEVKE